MVFGIHIAKSPRKVKDDSPTFHFDEDTTTTTPPKPTMKLALGLRHSLNNLHVDTTRNTYDIDDNTDDKKLNSSLAKARRHSLEPPRRLGSSRRRISSHKKSSLRHDSDESGSLSEESDDYNFMEEARKQRSRSLNTHNEITHDTDSPSSRLKIKGVCFVTNTGHEFQVRQRSNESLATK